MLVEMKIKQDFLRGCAFRIKFFALKIYGETEWATGDGCNANF
jgi:hypothetical protein